MTTVLECENCGHKFPSKEVELTNIEITKGSVNSMEWLKKIIKHIIKLL